MIGATTAQALLEEHKALFQMARHGLLHGRMFVGEGGRLYDVGHTLRVVYRELKAIALSDNDLIYGHEAAWRDLQNIIVYRSEWESESEG